jgi:hypothetical protein
MSHPTTESIDDRNIEFLRFSPYYINQHQLLSYSLLARKAGLLKNSLQGYNSRRACGWPQPIVADLDLEHCHFTVCDSQVPE